MAKRSETRKVPNLNVYPIDNVPVDRILESTTLVEFVYIETPEAIKAAIKSKKATATLFQINNSEAYLEIPKSEWVAAIDSCMTYFMEKERYEVCTELKQLRSKLEKPSKALV